jgi:hypothetical protein
LLHWPSSLKARTSAFDLDAIVKFIADAAWIRFERERQEHSRGIAIAPARVGATVLALFRQVEASLGEDPSSDRARAAVSRWRDRINREAGGNPETIAELQTAWRRRRDWPAGLRQWIASLYSTDVETFDRVADFIERTTSDV